MRYSIALERLVAYQQLADVMAGHNHHNLPHDATLNQVLRYAEPYYMSGEIIGVIGRAGEMLTEATLRTEDLPTPHGFVWLDTNNVGSMQWFAWGIFSDGIVVHSSSIADDEGNEDLVDNVWFYGDTKHADDRTRFWQLLYAFFAFVQQRIVTLSHERADRATRRRTGIPPEYQPLIRVVQLRARKHEQHAGEHEPRDWSCRWMVRGHWRNQPYKDAVRPKWIAPYVKGPDDAPLKPPRSTVFAVVR